MIDRVRTAAGSVFRPLRPPSRRDTSTRPASAATVYPIALPSIAPAAPAPVSTSATANEVSVALSMTTIHRLAETRRIDMQVEVSSEKKELAITAQAIQRNGQPRPGCP